MSEIIPQKKDSINILLLCSYDRDTLRIVGRLSNQIIRDYGSEDYEWSGRIVPVIARNVRVYHTKSGSHNYCIFSQRYKDKWSSVFFKNATIVDRMQCTNADHEELLKEAERIVIGHRGDVIEMKATLKIIELSKWSDIIFITKIKPLTKGGELIELTMIVCRYLFQGDTTVNKVVLFRKKGIKLSWMAKEMTELGKIRTHKFEGYEELWELARKELEVLMKKKGFKMTPIH